ncbi:hypothetical protein V2J09_011960 [Rumex salicifolius]
MKMIKIVAFLALLLVATSQAIDFNESDLGSDESLWDLYERWRAHHTVSRSLDEKHKRFNVFKGNVKHIHEVNKMDKPYKLRLNKFADLTNHEFRSLYAGSKISHHSMLTGTRDTMADKGTFMYADVASVPPSVDWRKKGAVTPVKDQGQCGSCWAFSTVVAVEGVNQIKTKKLVSLSEQELIDCDNTQNQGCNGGLMELAFDFVHKNGGLTTEDNYPYKANAVSIDGHEAVPKNDEASLLKAAANQPIAVAIDAGGNDFQFYSELNHGVGLVGYGATVDGTKYWIVKNSWGSEWGEKGYIRMARDVSAKEGLCGIAMMASYPVKTASSTTSKDEL